MHKINYFILALLTIFISGCSESNPTISQNQSFTIEASIRAILPLENKLWFAGSNGKYGFISDNEVKIDSLILEDKPLHFRAIGASNQGVYILTVENPALLYKVEKNLKTSLVYREEHNKVFYDAIAFNQNGDFGVAMGDPTDNCLSVIITKNGGETWTKVPCDKLPKVNTGEAAFAASNSNISIIENTIYIVSGGIKARVFKSKDFGDTWKVFETPIIQGGTMTGIFTTDFYDKKNGIIMGGNWEDKQSTKQTKAITSDGGETWKVIEGIPGYISCVQYIPNSKGEKLLATSTEGIYYSGDSGFNWLQLSNEGYYTLRFENDTAFWVGSNEVVTSYNLNYE